ncbi:restriction endonuclease subunit S [Clostridium sp. NSJ-49]|uniref:restriction endonuclease subunit S n=1 Tax=Clostridium sp. NSJ-49 TaxID=2763034 RepID=UPI00164C6E9D|nr:restriction endonuclease subunit S [Clostridium sp. NSJ-49]MBC5626628.1 restriction endonuclease subunit S [Clostridium sp. NSJ-49]
MSFNEWRYLKVGDVADVLNGYAFKSKDFIGEGIPVIKIKNIVPPSIDLSDAQYVSEELFNEKLRFALKYNDILISMTGSNINQISSAVGKIGRVRLKDKKLLLNQRVGKLYITDKNNCDEDFLYYYLIQDEVRYNLAASASGSANQANINPSQIKNITINLPPLEEQKAIAKVLSDLDKKIETNNKINKKLEEMAQAIFKQWFVDFEFPNENGEPYKTSGGEMVESELGMIPKGWLVDSLSNLVREVITGKTPSTKKSENYGDKYPFVTIPDMHNKVFVTKTERYLSEEGHNLQVNKLIPKNSIMVSCIATVGLVSISSESVHTNQQINSIIPDSIDDLYYFYEYLKLMEQKLKGIGSAGSATLNVNKGEFERIKYIYPNKKVLAQYHNIVNNNYEKIKLNEIENNSLIQLRDTLLPKLMSGEIRVPLDKQ